MQKVNIAAVEGHGANLRLRENRETSRELRNPSPNVFTSAGAISPTYGAITKLNGTNALAGHPQSFTFTNLNGQQQAAVFDKAAIDNLESLLAANQIFSQRGPKSFEPARRDSARESGSSLARALPLEAEVENAKEKYESAEARIPERPDFFLVTVRPEHIGHLDLTKPAWKSDDSLLISFSECHDRQEAMLLMPAYSWLRSDLGTFFIEPLASRP
jgi:hypothetical protein